MATVRDRQVTRSRHVTLSKVKGRSRSSSPPSLSPSLPRSLLLPSRPQGRSSIQERASRLMIEPGVFFVTSFRWIFEASSFSIERCVSMRSSLWSSGLSTPDSLSSPLPTTNISEAVNKAFDSSSALVKYQQPRARPTQLRNYKIRQVELESLDSFLFSFCFSSSSNFFSFLGLAKMLQLPFLPFHNFTRCRLVSVVDLLFSLFPSPAFVSRFSFSTFVASPFLVSRASFSNLYYIERSYSCLLCGLRFRK